MFDMGTAEDQSLAGKSPPNRVGYLARQPILDRRGGVFGYELRYHDPASVPSESKLAAGSGLIDALALFGVERFAGGQWAFIRCTEQMILDEGFEALPPSKMVLEFPHTPSPLPRLLRVCRRLREAGFRLALTEVRPGSGHDGLFDYVDYIKIDVNMFDTPAWESFSKHSSSRTLTIIGDNIQTHEFYRTARAAGIKYFQGYYFCSPDLIPNGGGREVRRGSSRVGSDRWWGD